MSWVPGSKKVVQEKIVGGVQTLLQHLDLLDANHHIFKKQIWETSPGVCCSFSGLALPSPRPEILY